MFLRLPPPRFSGAVEKDAHEFLTSFQERLYTSGLVKSKGADYMAYQLDEPAK